MAEQQNDSPPSQPAPAGGPDSARQGAAREGVSERGGEGGYGNDTGFATGTEAPTDGGGQTGDAADRHNDGGGSVDAGTSGREEQTSNTYRDAGQGRGSLDGTTH